MPKGGIRPIIKCPECGEVKPHKARGLCSRCYEKFRYYKRVADKQLHNRRKKDVNIAFFKVWGMEMAYTLGFICSDGYIHPTLNSFVIYNTDYDILNKMKAAMSAEKEIACYEKTKVYRLDISQKEIVKDLLKLGLTPAKSLTLKFPEVPNEYLSHFIRGYYDGNGYIQFKQTGNKPQITVRISTGSKDFAEGAIEAISKNEGISGSIHIIKGEKNNYYNVDFYGYNAIRFISWIYWNADGFYLAQKHDKAINFLTQFI